MNNNSRGAIDKLSKIQSIVLAIASLLTGSAGLALCVTHRLYGLTSNLLFTAAGFAGIWLILRTVKSVITALDKSGVVIVMGTAQQKQVPSADTASTVDQGAKERRWQTEVAAEAFAGTTQPQSRQEPRLGIPRTRQAPARIGGEWDD